MVPLLAQSGQSQGGTSVVSVLLWSGLLMVAVLLGAFAINMIRRAILGDGSEGETEGLSLHGLRQMHARGDLSDEEYEAAKAALLGLPAPDAEVLQAEPGYDLTGEPLPGEEDEDGDGPHR